MLYTGDVFEGRMFHVKHVFELRVRSVVIHSSFTPGKQ